MESIKMWRSTRLLVAVAAVSLMASGAAAQIGKREPMDKPVDGSGGPPFTVVEIPGFPGGARMGELAVDEDGVLYVWAVERKVKALPGTNAAREVLDPPEPPGGGPWTATSTILRLSDGAWTTALRLEGETAGTMGSTGRDVYATTTLPDGTVKMYRYNGKRWLLDRLPETIEGPVGMIVGHRNDVWFRSGPAIYKRHDRGLHSESAPGIWQEVYTAENLAHGGALAFVDRDEVYAPCCKGQLVYDGADWTWQPSATADIHGAWARRDADDVLHLFKVGSGMTQDGACVWSFCETAPMEGSYEMVLHDDPLGQPVSIGHMTHVWGANVHDVFTGGSLLGEGVVYTFDGVMWSKQTPLPAMPPVTGIAGTLEGETWIGLADGRLLHHAGVVSTPPYKRRLGLGAQSLTIAPRADGASVAFALATAADVVVSIHDLAGRRIATIDCGRMPAGSHEVRWNAEGSAPSIYFARVRAGADVTGRSFVLLR